MMSKRLSFFTCSLLACYLMPAGTAHAQQHGSSSRVPRAVPVYESHDMFQRVQQFPLQKVGVGDAHYAKTQLVSDRQQSGVDRCAVVPGQKSFLHAMDGAVRLAMQERQIESNDIIDKAYGLPGPANSLPVSLMSHPICIQDADAIGDILGKDYVPDAKTIAALRRFSEQSNEDRRRALAGDDKAVESFNRRWTQFMGCLAYSESLQTSDAAGVDERFKRAVANVPGSKLSRRPAGVLFAEDRHGEFFTRLRAKIKDGSLTPEARAKLESEYKPWPVVGMYQFDPMRGNTGPCVSQWNQINPACRINAGNKAELMDALASPGQTFNTFCGVQKIVQAFNSQVNTHMPTGVDKSNRLPNGRLKAPKDRCVSLVARAGGGRIYSHFGPLRNSVKDNLGKLMDCVKDIK